ncbi:MAG: MFS transporter [Inquilinus limosus]|uniref:MFS transporter n=1 Tax=Inquilinus limosus TaxID=171674 RepID=A0A952FHA0_9PROT|nr:MFS transporter [Inquilinus limosus]
MPSADTIDTPRSRTRPGLVLLAMCLGVLVAQIDTSVVNLGAHAIGAALGLGVSALQWVLDVYNLVYATLLLTGGLLGDLFGRRRIFVAGVAMFALGSLACGLAPDGTVLIAARAITGLGAALLLPASLSILAATYPDAGERAHAIGIWASCNGLAFAIGPTLGGILVTAAGWRSLFFVVVPVAALALLLAVRSVPESADPEGRRLDLPGQGLAMLALGALTLAAIEGNRWGWTSAATLAGLAVGLVAIALFLAVEARTEGALVPLGLFRSPDLSGSLIVALLMTFGMYAMLFLVPVYLQTVRGATPIEAGLELLPMSVVFFAVSQVSGRLATRLGPQALMTAGMALIGAGLLLLAWISAGTGLLYVETALLVTGIGLGLNTGPVMAVTVSSVPQRRSGTAAGLVNTARMVGATLGVAILGAVFAAYGGDVDASTERLIGGLGPALLVGGLGECLGAVAALALISRDALERKPG